MSFPSGARSSAVKVTADNEPVLHRGIELKMKWELNWILSSRMLCVCYLKCLYISYSSSTNMKYFQRIINTTYNVVIIVNEAKDDFFFPALKFIWLGYGVFLPQRWSMSCVLQLFLEIRVFIKRPHWLLIAEFALWLCVGRDHRPRKLSNNKQLR